VANGVTISRPSCGFACENTRIHLQGVRPKAAQPWESSGVAMWLNF
jgi:hypothetical protein